MDSLSVTILVGLTLLESVREGEGSAGDAVDVEDKEH